MEIIDNFVSDLELSLGVKHRRVSFDSLWDESPPPEADGQGLQEYMKDVRYRGEITAIPSSLILNRHARIHSSMMTITTSNNSARTTEGGITKPLM